MLAPLCVQLAGKMQDGQNLAVLVNPMPPLQWAAEGRSIPVALTDSTSPAGTVTPDDEALAGQFMRRIVMQSISHIRALRREDEDGPLIEFWLPIKLVETPVDGREPSEIAISRFDRGTHVTRVWNALIADLQAGVAELQAVEGKTF